MPAMPQESALLALYAPYCGGLNRQPQLERALVLLQSGRLAGQRPLREGASHPFELRWQPVLAPLDRCPCELVFPNQPGMTYRFELASYQLVAWLCEALAREPLSLPESFWRWLLLGEGYVAQPA
jgi:hypothetical protein